MRFGLLGPDVDAPTQSENQGVSVPKE
jgi:hypothetical protein